MTSLEHNRLHAHAPWNLGIKTPAETQRKMVEKRKHNYYRKCISVKRLWDLGLSSIEISDRLKISNRSVYERLKELKQYNAA